MPRGGKLSEILLAKATEVLNKIIRHSGYNSQELLTNKDQSTGAKLDLSDLKLSDLQWKMRVGNHGPSAKHQSRDAKPPEKNNVDLGDIILLKSEKSKHKAREKYFVVSVLNNEYVEVQKITENQIRAKKYKVKNEELIILKRFKDGENKHNLSDAGCSEEEYFSAEDILENNRETHDKTVKDSVVSETHLNNSTRSPKRLENKNKRYDESTCKFCIENSLQAIHHNENMCWRKKNFFTNPDRNSSLKVDSETETSDEDYEPDQDNKLITSEESIGGEGSDLIPNNTEPETDEEGEVTEKSSEKETDSDDATTQHQNFLCQPHSSHNTPTRYEETPPPRPLRSAPTTLAPPRPPRDIPGRLVTHGDLIKYFSGYIDTESQEEIWLTAVVMKMQMSEQRKYPNHYNVANEEGFNFSLELLPGEKWAVRRNNRWETF